jgi:hypothetical protein
LRAVRQYAHSGGAAGGAVGSLVVVSAACESRGCPRWRPAANAATSAAAAPSPIKAHTHHVRPPASDSDAAVVVGAAWTVTELVVAGADCVTVFSTVVVLAGAFTVFVGAGAVTVWAPVPETVDGVVPAAALVAWVFAAAPAVAAFSATVPDPPPPEPHALSATETVTQIKAIAPLAALGGHIERW